MEATKKQNYLEWKREQKGSLPTQSIHHQLK